MIRFANGIHAVWNADTISMIPSAILLAAEYVPSWALRSSCVPGVSRCTCTRSARLSAHSATPEGMSGSEKCSIWRSSGQSICRPTMSRRAHRSRK